MNLYIPSSEEKEKFRDYRIVVAMPSGGFPAVGFVRSLVDMVAYSWKHGLRIVRMATTERNWIHWARNMLAGKLRTHVDSEDGQKFTHILWLDDDHTFDADTAIRLAVNGDKDMITPLVYRRSDPILPCVFVYANDPNRPYQHHPMVDVPESVMEIDAMGFAFVLMRLEVLDKIPEPHFLINPNKGEDICFCMRAREFGVKMYVDGRVKIRHIGIPPEIGFDEHRRWLAFNPIEVQERQLETNTKQEV